MAYRKTAQYRATGDGGQSTTVVVLTDLDAVDTTKSGRWSSTFDAPKRFELPDGTPLTRVSKGVYLDPATKLAFHSSDPNAP